MKIGILTIFQTGNYGGTLQAYALKTAIDENRFGEAHIIHYSCDAVKGKIDRKFLKKAGLFRTAIACVEKIYYRPRMKKVRRFVASFADPVPLTRAELPALNDQYDIFLSGSDQIWNPDIQQGDYSYLLDFVTDDHKKRSYASSFGKKEIAPAYADTYRRLLGAYHALTVRETAGAALIKELTGREAPVTLDPVLLLTPAQWESKLGAPVYRKNYVFTYQMGNGPLPAKVTAKARRALGVKSLYVPFPIGGVCRAKCVLNFSSLEWVRAIHDAAFVVTDSFHAAVFAILFDRPFYYVVTSDTVRARLSRVETLFSTLGLTDRIVENAADCDFSKPIDYAAVHEKLNAARERSLSILEELCR